MGADRSLIALLLVSGLYLAQRDPTRPSSVPSVSTDPLQFIELAATVNGLGADPIEPWHVKATFQLLDHGNVTESGTFEGFWKSPDKYKMTYTSPSYTRTLWANEDGNFATSNPKWPEAAEWMIRRSLFDIAPEHGGNQDGFDLRWRNTSAGISLRCIDWIPRTYKPSAINISQVPSFCFDMASPTVRYSSIAMHFYQGIYNEILHLNDAYVPGDVTLLQAGKICFHLHVDKLEALAEQDEIFRPSPGAVPIHRRTMFLIDTNLRNVKVKRTARIVLPPAPRLMGSQPLNQEIVVQVLVDEKGKVVDAHAITGDRYMREEGEMAAHGWEFEPYKRNGLPTQFYTEFEFF